MLIKRILLKILWPIISFLIIILNNNNLTKFKTIYKNKIQIMKYFKRKKFKNYLSEKIIEDVDDIKSE